MKYLSAKDAAALDEHLMSDGSGWQLAQLMELAGLSVASCCHSLLSTSPSSSSVSTKPTNEIRKKKVLVICGPGNNGGDGLVAARHLLFFNHLPTVWYPKPKDGIYKSLLKQLALLRVPVITDGNDEGDSVKFEEYDYVIDAIFGFSFSGEPREPFASIIRSLATTKTPTLAVDVPSSWNIATGPPDDGQVGTDYMPTALISLSAPKECSRHFTGRHFLGGRFLDAEFAKEYELPPYPGSEQFVEITTDGEHSRAAL